MHLKLACYMLAVCCHPESFISSINGMLPCKKQKLNDINNFLQEVSIEASKLHIRGLDIPLCNALGIDRTYATCKSYRTRCASLPYEYPYCLPALLLSCHNDAFGHSDIV